MIKKIFVFMMFLVFLCAYSHDTNVPLTKKNSYNVYEITENNSISLRGPVEETSVDKIIDKIFSSKNKSLIFYIDSPGGDVDAGIKLVQAMRGSGKKFICIANFAASMAFSIFQQCDKRFILESSTLMQHLGSANISGSVNHMTSTMDLLHNIFTYLNELDSKRIGMSREDFYELIRDDWWVFGQDNITSNTADEIVEVRCDQSLTTKREIEEVDIAFFNIKAILVYSGCPMVSDPLKVTIVPLNPKNPFDPSITHAATKRYYKKNFSEVIKDINIINRSK